MACPGGQDPHRFGFSCRSLGEYLVVEILTPQSDEDGVVSSLFDYNLVFSANRHLLFPGKLIPLVFETEGKVILDRPLSLLGQDTKEGASLPAA